MKKINFMLFVIVLSISSVFCQSIEFTNHIEKAKEYENQKKYVSALGEYYDAMAEESTLSGKEAYEGWLKCSEIIQSGTPGYGEFDDFSFVDEWILLLQEYERYWTENCPIMIICDEPERVQLNREEKTATYEMGIRWEKSTKYEEIEKVFKSGLEKAYTTDWQMPFLKEWPTISVYNNKTDKNKFLQNGAALAQNLSQYNDGGYVYSEYKLLASLAEFGCIKRNLAGYYAPYDETTLYDLKLKLIDDLGQEIFLGKRLLLGPIAKYTFTVTQQQMQKIDNRKVRIVPDAVFLQYGNIPAEPWITEDSRDWIKTLSELKLDNNNVQIIFKTEQKEYGISPVELMKNKVHEYERQKEEDRIREEQQRRAEEKAEAEKLEERISLNEGIIYLYMYISEEIKPNLIKNKFYEKSYYDRDVSIMRDAYINNDTELWKIYFEDSEKFINAMQYVMCNAISGFENLTAVYSIAGHTSCDFLVDELKFYLINYDKVEENLTANGWRIPNEKEVKAAERVNSLASRTRTIVRNAK